MSDENVIGIKAEFDDSEWQEGIDSYNQSLEDVSSNTEEQASIMSDAFENLSSAGGAIFGGLAVGMAGMTASLYGAVDAGMEVEGIFTKIDFAVEKTGAKTGITTKQISDLADSISKVAPFDDEVIASAAEMGMTFDGVNKDNLQPLLEAATDLSAKTGKALPGAMKMLAMSMGDPTRATRALRLAGITLTETEKEQLKTWKETGDLASAQAFIFDRLNAKVGGLAKTMGGTLEGKMTIFQTSMGNLSESLGAGIVPQLGVFWDLANKIAQDPKLLAFLTDLGNQIGEVLKWIGELTTELVSGDIGLAFDTIRESLINFVPQWVIDILEIFYGLIEQLYNIIANDKDIWVAALGAMGVALIAFGITAATALAPVIAAIAPVIATMLVVMGIIYVLKKAWDSNFLGIKTTLLDVWDVIQPIIKDLQIAIGKISDILLDGFQLEDLKELGKIFSETIENIKKDILNIDWSKVEQDFLNTREAIIKGLQEIGIEISKVDWGGIIKGLDTARENFKQDILKWSEDTDLFENVGKNIGKTIGEGIRLGIPNIAKWIVKSVAEIPEGDKMSLSQVLNSIFKVTEKVNDPLGIKKAVVNGVLDIDKGIIEGLLGSLFGTSLDGVKKEIEKKITGMFDVFSNFSTDGLKVFEAVDLFMENMNADMPLWEKLKSSVAGALTAFIDFDQAETIVNNFESAIKEAISPITDFIQKLTDFKEYLQSSFFGALEKGKQNIVELFTNISNTVSDTFNNLKKTLDDISSFMEKMPLFKEISDTIKSFQDGDWYNFGVNLHKSWNKFWKLVNPITAIQIAFALVTDFLSKKWDEIIKTSTTAWEDLKTNLTKTWETIVKSLQDTWTSIVKTLTDTWNKVPGFFADIWTQITTTASKQWETFKENIISIWEKISKAVQDKWKEITEFFTKTDFKTVATNTFNKFLDGVKDKMTEILKSVTDKWKEIEDFFKGIDLTYIGTQIVQGLIDGMNSLMQSITDTATNVADAIKKAIEGWMNVKSPSRVMMNIGENIMLGLEKGIQDFANKPINATLKVAQGLTGAFGQSRDTNNTTYGGSLINSYKTASANFGDIKVYVSGNKDGEVGRQTAQSIRDALRSSGLTI